MIVLYAVVPRGVEVVAPGLCGHDAGPVTVVYEETATPPSPSRDAVAEHGRRIVALADRGPLLPMRYGTTLPGMAELRSIGVDHGDAWRRRLDRLAGRRELVVHVAAADVAPPVDGSGRAYLQWRLRAVRRQDHAVEKARELVLPWADDLRLLPDRRRLAVLVRIGDADRVRDAVAVYAAAHPDLELVVTGPWPPFSFCEEAEPS